MKQTEIEQKFLFKYIPFHELRCIQRSVVYRKYVSTAPEVRINKRIFETGEVRTHLTIKQGGFLTRSEIKLRLTSDEYEEIFDSIDTPAIVVDVIEFLLDGEHTISFELCRDLGVTFAEIKYGSGDDYREFAPVVCRLPFLAEEVTYDKMYYLKNIWETMQRNGKNLSGRGE